MKEFYLKLSNRPRKQLIGTIIIAYTVFSLIIIVIFIPTSTTISKTGYSTTDLQQATTTEEVDEILREWTEVIPIVYIQYLGDFIFLIAGLIGNCAIFVLLGKKIKEKGNVILPLIGFITVFLSRGSDALENTLTLVIITFPKSYPDLILNILPYIPIIKFIFVGVVYSLIIINLVYYLYLRQKFS